MDHMSKLRHKKQGLALAEALMAVALLAVGAVIAGTLIKNGILATRISKEYLVGQNLVTEGIEAVRNIRDTNWLRNPLDTDCWLKLDPDNTEECSGSVLAQTEISYITKDRSDGSWVLEDPPGTATLDLVDGTGVDAFILYLVEEDSSVVGLYDRYTADKNAGGAQTEYYRSIEFLEMSPDSALFEVKVQWYSASTVREVSRKILMYNYY